MEYVITVQALTRVNAKLDGPAEIVKLVSIILKLSKFPVHVLEVRFIL